jgi:hypothetical protein
MAGDASGLIIRRRLDNLPHMPRQNLACFRFQDERGVPRGAIGEFDDGDAQYRLAGGSARIDRGLELIRYVAHTDREPLGFAGPDHDRDAFDGNDFRTRPAPDGLLKNHGGGDFVRFIFHCEKSAAVRLAANGGRSKVEQGNRAVRVGLQLEVERLSVNKRGAYDQRQKRESTISRQIHDRQ